MKKVLIVAIIMGCFTLVKAQDNTVHLKGELRNFDSEAKMHKGTPKAQLLKESIQIKLDDQNQFEISFELDEPSYFDLGRNTLYLSPGDNLEMMVDRDVPGSVEFKGTGAEACIYLKNRPFPKAGSYLYGTNILDGEPSVEEVAKRVSKHVKVKQKELKALKNVSPAFKKMEHGRILFDAANSLMSYGGRLAYKSKVSQEKMMAFMDSISAIYQKDIDKYLAKGNDKDYLNLGVFLGVSDRCIELFGEDNIAPEILDFMKSYELIYYLNSKGPVEEVLSRKAKEEASFKTDEYKAILNKAFGKYNRLIPGQKAPVFEMSSLDGQLVSLEHFKGKLLVIDVWATWCGPCKAESPYFEALAEKYGSDEVEFISISIDSSEKPWKDYLAEHEKTSSQYITQRLKLGAYELMTVPRFMVIGKDGNIIDAFAPMPSSPEFEEKLTKIIF